MYIHWCFCISVLAWLYRGTNVHCRQGCWIMRTPTTFCKQKNFICRADLRSIMFDFFFATLCDNVFGEFHKLVFLCKNKKEQKNNTPTMICSFAFTALARAHKWKDGLNVIEYLEKECWIISSFGECRGGGAICKADPSQDDCHRLCIHASVRCPSFLKKTKKTPDFIFDVLKCCMFDGINQYSKHICMELMPVWSYHWCVKMSGWMASHTCGSVILFSSTVLPESVLPVVSIIETTLGFSF